MASLMDKLKKAGSVSASSILSKSIYFTSNENIHTDLPILNAAFSGDIDGGLTSGVTVFAGPSKCYKSMLSLYAMKAYMDKYEDAISLFYDSEFGIPVGYMEAMGIDCSRIIHIPVTNLEDMKFDMVQRLEQVERGDHVFIMVDSIGNLASKREYENAINENTAKDMSRAQEIKSFFRIVTPHITMKNLCCIFIAHTYQEMGLYPKQIVSGGTGVMYSANTVFIISKSQEKQGTDIVGYNFTINIEKSRFVKEKAKLTFQVLYESGIQKYSGLADIAIESGHIVKPNQGWYSRVNKETGEVEEKKWRAKDMFTDDFWKPILKSPSFKEFIKHKYQLSANQSNIDSITNETVEMPNIDAFSEEQ